MPAGRPFQPLHLSPEEAGQLKELARCPKSSQALALRLGAEQHPSASQLDVSRPTVCKWHEWFWRHGLASLDYEPRPGAPRSICDEQVEQVVRATLETMPEQGTHWTTRQMAKKMGLSQTAIVASGGPLVCNPIGWKASNCPPTRCLSRGCGTL